MSKLTKDVWLARAGAPLGIGLAALAVAGWTMPAGDAPAGVSVTLTANPTGELDLRPSGELIRRRELQPGEAVDASLTVANIAPEPRKVALRAAPALRDLDPPLRIETRSNGQVVAGASARAARRWSELGVLRSGERRSVDIRIELPANAREYEYGVADIGVDLRSDRRR